jgi:hypothetical protein
MSLSYYEGRRPPKTQILRLLAAFNVAFVVSILGGWALVSYMLANPLSWATWATLPTGRAPDYFEYPFVVLWVVPVVGLFLAWIAHSSRKTRLAIGILLVPALFLAVTLGWFHLAPADMR